ncbi:MAG: 1-acyl-sn-glycerol-3-phosphate acyltransferase [Spirochaetia bacterium]|nr:1-acyl-sn-glycerol-3-phosphate acyltransferase [Spirochaetia bacterium]
MIQTIARFVFFNFVIRPVVHIYLGVRIKHRDRLPVKGPAIIAANHNSHLDAMVLLTIFGRRISRKLRPVAAADYFLRNRVLAWFALKVIGIIPLSRNVRAGSTDPLELCHQALKNRDILIIFPEGSRGEAERLSRFKSGIAHLAKKHPYVPVIPVFLHGLGKALPKGEFLIVPFYVDVVVGEPIFGETFPDKNNFMDALEKGMSELATEIKVPEWD